MKLKKVLSAILAAAMVLSTMSFTVFAGTADVIIDGTDYTVTSIAELEKAIANATTSVVINGGNYTAEDGGYDYVGLRIETKADVIINGGNFEGSYIAGLFVENVDNLTINDGSFESGFYALKLNNTTAKINGGCLKGELSAIDFEGDVKVDIAGGEIKGGNHIFYTGVDSSTLLFSVSGGILTTTEGYEYQNFISGGIVSEESKISDGGFEFSNYNAYGELTPYIDESLEFVDNGKGQYILAEKPVAKVNGVGYDTLIEAIEAANEYDTIELCKDFVIDSGKKTDYELPAGSILDLGGNTLGVAATNAIFKGDNITIRNGSILSPSDDVKQNYTLYIGNESKVTVDSVKTYGINISVDSEVILNNVTAHVQKNKYYAVYAGAGTTLSITGDDGYYRSGYSTAKDVYAADGANVAINGGFFYYADSVEGFLADGYQLVRNKHNNGTVKKAHKVTFDANGGENAMDAIIIVSGESAVITTNAFAKTGYEFDGWNTSIDGTGTAYTDGATVTPDADVTLYAQWKAAEYNINYELNGGTNDAAAPTKHTYGTATTLLGATLTDKTFAGWYTDSALTSASRVTQLDAEAYTADITLYAKWVDEATITSGIEVRFEQDTTDADGRTYNIVLASDSVLPFNRLTAADLTFKIENDTTDRTDVSYEIVAKEGTNITVNDVVTDTLGSTRTEFHYNGTAADSGKTDSIIIGQVKFEGYGAFTFGIDESDMTVVKTLAVQGTTEEDNIVIPYEFYGIDKTLIVNDDVPAGKGIIDTALETKKQTLTINVAFNNEINGGSSVAYKGMKYTISGGDLESVISGTFKVLDGKADSVVIANELSQFESYTVTLEAAGYRTAKYTVNMQDKDKELYFWNNVKDDINAMTIEKDASESLKVTKNFLAGDIVKDSKINIYDLSAVVSYFGTNTDEKPEYAKYDLNRDRIIDSTDVAMVLVSWGE